MKTFRPSPLICTALTLLALATGGCHHASSPAPHFVTVGSDGNFYIGDSVYRFMGTNAWHAAILASTGQGGDRELLARELDLMQQNGIDNLRLLAGGDGENALRPHHIMPTLQTAPGVYNDTILDGLDYLMAQLEQRGMKAIVYLNNAWEWSGGYGTYLEWSGAGKAPDPTDDGYNNYVHYVAQFVHNDSARAMAARHVQFMVSRTNRYTGQPYSESPALMAWEIANEPRAFAADAATKEAFCDWVLSTASLIKSIDKNHLVATGSEGKFGCEVDLDLWARIHNAPQIDYAIIHLWPFNWQWVSAATLCDSIEPVYQKSVAYISEHARVCSKPLVLEEFGYPRDGKSHSIEAGVTGRDLFYKKIFDFAESSGLIAGVNFWGWGGTVPPAHEWWQPWDPYTGDPAQEPQGLYSVFASDTTTLGIISASAKRMNQQPVRANQ